MWVRDVMQIADVCLTSCFLTSDTAGINGTLVGVMGVCHASFYYHRSPSKWDMSICSTASQMSP